MQPPRRPRNPRTATKPLSQIAWGGRASRHFTSEPVPARHLETMLLLASQAPCAHEVQPSRFVVVQEPEKREQLSRAADHADGISGAPVLIVAFADTACVPRVDQTARSGLERSGGVGEPVISGVPAAVWLNRHVMTAFTYLILAASSLGWDATPIEEFDASAVRAIVGLPADAEVVALLAIGRHFEPDEPDAGRLPLDRMVFAEHFGAPSAFRTESESLIR